MWVTCVGHVGRTPSLKDEVASASPHPLPPLTRHVCFGRLKDVLAVLVGPKVVSLVWTQPARRDQVGVYRPHHCLEPRLFRLAI